jgi:hypothetical protein
MVTRTSDGHDRGRARKGIAGAAGLLALLLLPSCSSNLFGNAPPPDAQASNASPGFTQRLSDMFAGPVNSTTGTPANLPAPDIDCPGIDVRPGASTYSVNATSGDVGALGLRYQGSLGQTARECARAGADLAMKIGVQGRIILGPAGGPGHVEVPLRLAVVREGPDPQTIWTKFYAVPVDIPPGQTNVPFTHVDQEVSFPMPPPAELQRYVVYVGFDPLGLTRQQPARKKPQRKR